ncbi:hypothetical protein EYV94_00820 [Puteibacter caeruleilacunae]|nr:hypothetical protein EYV94_00820 [Puteibacter caeruleilacunae]
MYTMMSLTNVLSTIDLMRYVNVIIMVAFTVLLVWLIWLYIRKKKQIDRMLSGAIMPQLVGITMIIVVIWLAAIGLANWVETGNILAHNDNALRAIYNFLDAGTFQNSNYSIKSEPIAIVLSLSGLVILGGIFIAVVTNYYDQRVQRYKQGYGNYSFNNQLIIVGYHPMTLGYVTDFFEEQGTNKCDVIILTEQSVEDVSRELKSNLPKEQEKHVYVMQGSRDSVEEIQRTQPWSACKIIILGEDGEDSGDARNVDCFELISNEVVDRKITTTIPCYVHFNELSTFQMAKDYNPKVKERGMINFIPFNFYERWARHIFVNFASLFGKQPAYPQFDYERIHQNSDKHVHFVLVGFNRMSVALASQAIHHCHFPNYQKGKKNLKLTFIDKNCRDHELYFLNLFPGINALEDIELEFLDADIYAQSTKDKLVAWSANDDKLLYLAICMKHADTSLSVALKLPREIYQKGIPVLVRQYKRHVLHDQVYPSIFFFGMIDENLRFDKVHNRLALEAHFAYQKSVGNEMSEEDKNEERAYAESSFSWASAYLVDNYPYILRSFDVGLDEVRNVAEQPNLSDDRKVMANLEHRRWMAERVLFGFVYGADRNDALKIHNCMMPFEKLSKSETDKDNTINQQIMDSLNGLGEDVNYLPTDESCWKLYMKTASVKAKQLTENDVANSLEGNVAGLTGDYFCKGIKDEEWIVPAEKFLRKYKLSKGQEDKDATLEFLKYEPVPEETMVYAQVSTIKTNIPIENGNDLEMKVGDYHLKAVSRSKAVKYQRGEATTGYLDDPNNIEGGWVVAPDIFNKSYCPISKNKI